MSSVPDTDSQAEKPKLWLGLPPSEPDTYTGPWQKEEKWTLWLLAIWCAAAIIGTLIGFYSTDPDTQALFALPEEEVWMRVLRQIPLTFFVYMIFGWAVEKWGVNVVFTRKFGHILFIFLLPLFFVPGEIAEGQLYRAWYTSVVWNSLFSLVLPYVLLVQPIRKRFRPFYYTVRAFDRPEDRPYTLIWFMLQMLTIGLFQIPMTQYFVSEGLWSLYLISAFANGLGDGLAEPVGKIWGKKKYKVKALFTQREYTRSYMGSATVFVATTIGVLINYNMLTGLQFAVMLAVMPALMTIIEAKSPHTFDNAFMFAACWAVCAIVINI